MDRRHLLRTAAAGAALPFAGLARAATGSDARAELHALFDAFFHEGLRRSPEQATQLGLDKGPDADLRARLRDETPAGVEAARAATADQLKRLQAFDRARLAPADRLDYDTVLYTRRSSAALNRFAFGGAGSGPSPYVVSQNTGAYQQTPDFLDTKHRVDTAEDADAYLSRLDAFAGQLDGQTERMKRDDAAGVTPPDFLLDLTLAQMQALQTAPDQSLLVTSITRRAAAKGLGERYGRDAARLYAERVRPALDRQLAQAKAMRAHATPDAGVWKIKGGDAYYAAALSATTTTRLTPEEVHKLGLDQARDISARIDTILKSQGYTQGTVAARIQALYKDPKSNFANTDAGKAEAIAYCNDRLAAIRPRLPRAFNRLPDGYRFEVRRVPPATELGAASAFSQSPPIDGSRPGLVYVNLHDTAEWPRWSLPSVIFHEGLPGHQFEGALALSNTSLPLIRKTIGFSGYAEGWALYAEQLADELGMYDDDPLGRIGYLKFQLFRAGRCIVDTGIHHYKWSREKAIQTFVELEGDAPGFAAREVERYCSTPGQACSYKIGHTVFIKARERAKAALGARFDIKAFHDAGLGSGRVPLDILDAVIDAWIERARSAA